ncbi:MAG: hypothetical protein K9N35_11225 [Candidatus Marinimicrobia bacterium]|nr:hypothetical protein [Candidatus Neomarinimicrobiota bacterium]
MSTLILFEPENLASFGPMTLLRSVGDLRYGIYSNIERAQRMFPDATLHQWIRPVLAADQHTRYPEIAVNQDIGTDGGIFLNAAIPAWMYPLALELLENESQAAVIKNGILIAAKSNSTSTFTRSFHKELKQLKSIKIDEDEFLDLPSWIWDYLDQIRGAIEFDLQYWNAENESLSRINSGISTLGEKHIYVHNTAQISNFVQLDASQGPIVIGKDCQIGPFCTLEGPLFIGNRSTIKPSTSIRTSVIGGVCNLGGEIKGSIIHPYSNKSHSGFLGDSILGSWVNLGADSSCSNLKNNYQPIKVSWDGNNYDTNRQFLGAIIGDHSKTAIGVRLNTGTLVGPFCNIFEADFPPRALPSFSWGNGTHDLDKAIQTAQRVMNRRGHTLSPEHETLIRELARDNSRFIRFK